MRRLGFFGALAVVAAAVTAACGSTSSAANGPRTALPTNVQLSVATKPTGGKALVFTASISADLASQKGHLYSLSLQGNDTSAGQKSFDHPGYTSTQNCIGGTTCQWTLAPDKAGKYQYRALLSDLVQNNTAGQSNKINVHWTAPPKPRSIKLFVNGKRPPHVSLDADHYSNFQPGPMRALAKWTTNVRNSGYYLTISDDFGVHVKCSSGTSCRVPKKVPLKAGQEDSWVVQVWTTRGNKVVGGFKACVIGVAKQ